MTDKETIEDFLRRAVRARRIAQKLSDPSERDRLLEFLDECETLAQSITSDGA